LAVLAAYSAMLLWMGLTIPTDRLRELFSEEGPFERLSVVFWVGLAALAMVARRPLTLGAVCGAYVALCCAARELDWHKQFTGYSVLKPKFFLMADQPLETRLIAGVVVAGLGLSAAVVALGLVRRLGREGRPVRPWALVSATGLALLVGTKLLDRSTGLAQDLVGHDFSDSVRDIIVSLEEGMEMALPVIFMVAVVSAGRCAWACGCVRRA